MHLPRGGKPAVPAPADEIRPLSPISTCGSPCAAQISGYASYNEKTYLGGFNGRCASPRHAGGWNRYDSLIAPRRRGPGRLAQGSDQVHRAVQENGFEPNLIFHKGGGPLYQDALAGVTDLSVSSLANMMPHVSGGKLKLVGVTGAMRSKLAPDVPTLAEQGVKSRPSYSWWGLYAPTGTPQPIVDRMYAAIAKAVRDKDVTDKFVGQFDMEITLPSSADFAAYIKSEVEVWGQVIRENKITAG